MAYRALRELDISEEDAYKSIELFRDYDEKLLIQQQRIYTDEQKIYETHRNALAELEHLFESDAQIRQEPTGVNLQRGLAHPRIDVTRDDSN
jgi:glutathione-regulated potassium-efflux system protein KefB